MEVGTEISTTVKVVREHFGYTPWGMFADHSNDVCDKIWEWVGELPVTPLPENFQELSEALYDLFYTETKRASYG